MAGDIDLVSPLEGEDLEQPEAARCAARCRRVICGRAGHSWASWDIRVAWGSAAPARCDGGLRMEGSGGPAMHGRGFLTGRLFDPLCRSILRPEG